MKGILLLIDGLGDIQYPVLGDKTPLESAEKPNMNFLATRGELGFLYPVRPGFIPNSENSILSIFGNKESEKFKGRIEAESIPVKVKDGDLVISVSFSTIDSIDSRNIVDKDAGRNLTNKEISSLCKSLNKMDFPFEFELIPTLYNKAILIFRGNFDDKVSTNNNIDSRVNLIEDLIVKPVEARSKDKASLHTANLLNDFLEEAFEILDKDEVNLVRRERGFLPANFLLLNGISSENPDLKKHKNWASFTYSPLEKGFAKLSGMENFSFNYPSLKNYDSYSNFEKGLKLACKKAIKVIKKNKNSDYCLIHLKETNFPGVDNKPFEKRKMIEIIDKTLVKFLRRYCPPNEIEVLITGNYSTLCKTKSNSSDLVPILFFNCGIPREKEFNETEARKGTFGRCVGFEILKRSKFAK